jgi:hypothetical protein
VVLHKLWVVESTLSIKMEHCWSKVQQSNHCSSFFWNIPCLSREARHQRIEPNVSPGHWDNLIAHTSVSNCLKPQVASISGPPKGGFLPLLTSTFWPVLPHKVSKLWCSIVQLVFFPGDVDAMA